MQAERRQYLEMLYQRYHVDDAQQADRLNRWRSMNPNRRYCCRFWCKASKPRNCWKSALRAGISPYGLRMPPSKRAGFYHLGNQPRMPSNGSETAYRPFSFFHHHRTLH